MKEDKKFTDKLRQFIVESFDALGKYLYGKILVSFLIAIVTYAIFKLINVNIAWLHSLILGTTNMLPVFGPWVGLIICAVIALFQSPSYMLYVVLIALSIQLIDQFLLTPLIVGKSVKLKPLLIVSVVILGSLLFGFWGVVFAVPAASIIKIGYTIFFNKPSK